MASRSMAFASFSRRPSCPGGPTATTDDWLAIANRNIRSGGDDEYVRVWTEVRATLEQQKLGK